MDMGDGYAIRVEGKRYEISTYPACGDDWAEINGEVARVVTSSRFPVRKIPAPVVAAAAEELDRLIATEEIDEADLIRDLGELADAAAWMLIHELEERRNVAGVVA